MSDNPLKDLHEMLNYRTTYFIYDEVAGAQTLKGVVNDAVIARAAELAGYYVVRLTVAVSIRRIKR